MLRGSAFISLSPSACVCDMLRVFCCVSYVFAVSYTVKGDVYDFGYYIFNVVVDYGILSALSRDDQPDLRRALSHSIRDCVSDEPHSRPTFASLLAFFNKCITEFDPVPVREKPRTCAV